MVNSCEDFYTQARLQMVEEQIVARGIRNQQVLDAMRSVPRELFVPEKLIRQAFDDNPLPVAAGQTISQPYIVAAMSELLELPPEGGAKILEIGTGTGYQAAVLAHMGHKVFSIERLPELVQSARWNIAKMPFEAKIKIILGDGSIGHEEEAPYDGIIVTAAAPQIPKSLAEQVRTGGKIVIPCGNPAIQELIQATKLKDGQLELRCCMGCRFVPLIGLHGFHLS